MRSEPGPPTKEEITEFAPVVLTGGHGGAVPAFIVQIVRKIFRSK